METKNNTAAQIAALVPEADQNPRPTADEIIAKMHDYYSRTIPGALPPRYDMNQAELRALYTRGICNGDFFEAITAAFEYGLAKGYRAAQNAQRRQRQTRRNRTMITAAKVEG